MPAPKEKQTFYSVCINGKFHDVTGRKRTPSGYVTLCIKTHPKSDVLGYVFEHRVVMEMKLNRYLEEGEAIHHKNEIKHDNRLSNLQLMDHGKHTAMHHIGSIRGQRARKNISAGARKRWKTPDLSKEQMKEIITNNKPLRVIFKELNIHQSTYYKFVKDLGLEELHKQYRGRN